ncbi:unnamed protein product [Orchesella dallaii]|uniref:Odorant receptor n=1 Tax=Orchesella dallaii TaxID=48710 RepID=A0ABP1RR64_9HEXA
MVLLDGLIKFYVINLRFCDAFGSVPYEWNIKAVWLESGTFVLTHNAMFVTDYLANIAAIILNSKKPKEIVALLNRFLEFEEKRKSMEPIKQEKGRGKTKILMQMVTQTGLFMPPLYHLDILRNPCFPMYLGYWVSEQCPSELEIGIPLPATWSLLEFGTKVVISLLSYMNWSFILTSHCSHVLGLVLQAHCLRSYIKQYGKDVLNSKAVDKNTMKEVMTFRELQVLALQYRKLNCSYFLTTYTLSTTMLAVICLYSSISAAESGSVQLGLSMLYLWCAFSNCFIILFIYGIFADVFRVSKRVQREMNCKVEFKKNKWYTRFLKTCPPIRIFIGGTNFFDELTPLTLEDFVVNQTVSLLLLK